MRYSQTKFSQMFRRSDSSLQINEYLCMEISCLEFFFCYIQKYRFVIKTWCKYQKKQYKMFYNIDLSYI